MHKPRPAIVLGFVMICAVCSWAVHALRAGDEECKDSSTNEQDPELWRIADTLDVGKMRLHAWKKLLEITGCNEDVPLWTQWAQTREVFGHAVDRKILFFEEPSQLSSDWKATDGPRLLQTVHFNRCAQDHIQEKDLNKRSTLATLRDCGDKFIVPFPREAMVVKAVWWPVREQHDEKDPPSPLPVWDDLPNIPAKGDLRYPYSKWPRLAAVASRGRGESTQEIKRPGWWFGPDDGGNPTTYGARVFPLEAFYVHRVTQPELDDDRVNGLLQGMFDGLYGQPCKLNDPLVLVGMHLATKELDDWVWMTFWWHDRPDQAESRALSLEIKGRAAYLKMDVTFVATTPRESDGSPQRIFNPWLEGGLRNGVRSSCITCHQRASWCIESINGSHVVEYPAPPDARFFRDKMRLDYIWSILDENIGEGCPK